MRFALLLSFCCGIVLAGCAQKPPEPPKEEPKDPSVAEYSKKLRDAAPFYGTLGGLSDEMVLAGAEAAKNGLRSTASGCTTENGQAAVNQFADELLNSARAYRDQEKWGAVYGCCMLHAGLTNNEEPTKRMKARADQILSRPQIKVQGFMESGSQLFISLRCKDLKSGAVADYRLQEGEEFGMGLKIVRILGNRQGIEIQDLTNSDTWEVYDVPSTPKEEPAALPAAEPAPAAGATLQ